MGVPLGPVLLFLALLMVIASLLTVAVRSATEGPEVTAIVFASISFVFASAGLLGYIFNAQLDRWSDD